MKKILTVSLFAMMAVSAANADIASTNYVGDQIKATAGTLNDLTTTAKGNLVGAINEVDANIGTVTFTEGGSAKEASNLTEAINLIDAKLMSTSNSLTGDITSRINELDGEIDAINNASTGILAQAKADAKSKADAAQSAAESKVTALQDGAVKTNTDNITAMDKAYKDADTALGNRLTTAEGDITALETSLSETGTTGKAIADNKKAIAAMDTAYKAADTALDGRVDTLESDNTTNKSNITNLQTAVNNLNTGTNSVSNQIAKALEVYSTTEEMNTAITNNAVNTVESGSDNGTIAVDGQDVAVTGLGSAAYTASSAYDAAGSAATAKSEAVATAKTETTNQVNALKNGAVKTNTDNITTITTNLGGLNGVTIPAACQTGRCALVMEAGKAKWETING